MITRDVAKSLPHGAILHHKTLRNADNTPLRARVNGRCKVWKTRPKEFQLPMKYGFRQCFYVTHNNASDWELSA
jgi:hypothetical protein